MRPGAERDLGAPAADVDHDCRRATHVDAVNGRHVDEPGLLDSGDHPDGDPGLTGDLGNEIPTIVSFADSRRRGRHDLVHFVRIGEAPELGQGLEGCRHGRAGEAPAVQSAGAEADHFLFPVNNFEGQVRTDTDHDHVDRVGSDVDRGDTHEGGEETAGLATDLLVTSTLYTAGSV